MNEEYRATPGEGRSRLVESAVKSWSGQLVDLSGRNNLLYYRDLRVGSLPLDDCPKALLFAALEGRSVLLTSLFPDEAEREGAIKRARAVRNKASAHFEERGLETLYLAVGMASWTPQKSASQPAAPVLLVPVRLAPKGAAQEEFEMTVTGELEVNPTFLQMLKAAFDIACDPAGLLASSGIEGIIDTPEELEITYDWLRETCANVPGFKVADRFVVGNFSYAKLPMVRDLEGAIEALAEHDLIAALAGDPGAQEALRQAGTNAPIPSPDFTPPADEFIVLDADSSQNYAINAVLAGRSLIIKGPPGTGKSQTITNLISTLVARGKRVLFVAEKRAAIDAVLRRLEEVGLGDLVLDLHGAVSSRRQTARALAAALSHNGQLAKPALEKVHQRLEQRRGELLAGTDSLHRERDPWTLSFYEVLSRLLALPPQVTSEIRLRGAHLEGLNADAKEKAAEDLQALIRIGGLDLTSSGSPWAAANVVSAEQAVAMQARVENLRADLDRLQGQLQSAATETGLQDPGAFSGWEEILSVWEEAEGVVGVFDQSIFELDLVAVARDSEPMSRSGAARLSASLSNGAYRRARGELRSALVPGSRQSPARVHETARRAGETLERWTALRDDPTSNPRPCSGREPLTASFQGVASEIESLCADLATERPGRISDLRHLLDSLLADVATLGRLPECHRLRGALDHLQLAPLLGEVEARGLDAERATQLLDFVWLSSIREHLQLTDQRLGAFDGEARDALVSDFKQADREHIETTPQRVLRRCAEAAVAAQDADEQGAALIRSEAAKKRKHLAIRQLFSAAPDVMTTLKPCWVMSPLIVSQVLPHDQPHFDVVVFDEQVR